MSEFEIFMLYFIQLRNAIAIYIVYLEVKKFFRRSRIWNI